MPTFTVCNTYQDTEYAYIEADTKEEALELAEEEGFMYEWKSSGPVVSLDMWVDE